MALLSKPSRAAVSALVAFALAAGDLLPAAWGQRVPHMIAVADAAPVDEDQVKAAFLFNFAKFVTWPAGDPDGDPLAVCVLGSGSFDESLEKVIGGRPVGGRSVVVRDVSSTTEMGGCEIVFVRASEDSRAASILDHVGDKPILTVGESEGFAARGGIINFRVEESRVRFEVNPAAATRAGLELSSQLLKLAILVRP